MTYGKSTQCRNDWIDIIMYCEKCGTSFKIDDVLTSRDLGHVLEKNPYPGEFKKMYEYRCKECGHLHDLFVRYGPYSVSSVVDIFSVPKKARSYNSNARKASSKKAPVKKKPIAKKPAKKKPAVKKK